MDYLANVVQAIPGEDFTVYAYFSDGSVRQADMRPYIEKGGIFARLADEKFFRERLTVMNGAVASDMTGARDATQCIDFDPCVMHEKSPVVTDPLCSA